MTIKELRDALANVATAHDGCEVQVWLPGSRISLSGRFMVRAKPKYEVLIEGNVEEGSALSG